MKQIKKFGIVIHGGAGYILISNYCSGNIPLTLPIAYENEVKTALQKALDSGFQKLSENSTALQAVEAAVRCMEDCHHFNAGKGSVKNENGEFEMDASIMDGSTLKSGAVGCVKFIKNPITAASKVLNNCKHNFLVGEGAQQFAKQNDCEFKEQSYFESNDDVNTNGKEEKQTIINQLENQKEDNSGKYGTVGAVALDKFGNLAAATSTGGLQNKKAGRVGDSPIIGHGNYANKYCAISATGNGEKIMKAVMAHDIASYMEYKESSLEEAVNYVLFTKFQKLLGEKAKAGVIAIDCNGNFCYPFSTLGMFRGFKMSDNSQDILFR